MSSQLTVFISKNNFPFNLCLFSSVKFTWWPDVIPLSFLNDVNKEMKMVNGNRRHGVPFLDVVNQNIPGNTNLETIQLYVELIIRRYRPAVLVVSEVSTEKMQNVVLDDYTWIGGKKKGYSSCRVSLFVQKCYPMEEVVILSELPVVGVKLGEYTICGMYWEWASQADQETRVMGQQVARSQDFVREFKKVKGKSVLCGDFNFCWKDETSPYQKSLSDIRDLYHQHFLASGWDQWISRFTRVQRGCSPSMLDHVYTKSVIIGRTYTKSIIGTDHLTTGVRVCLKKPLFQPESFSKRNLKEVSQEMFARRSC